MTAWGAGGGIYLAANCSPIISGNIISDNSCNGNGGGILCANNSNPTISSNIISGNSNMLEFGAGGGICCIGSSPDIIGNTISGNSTPWSDGGGIFCENSSPSIIGNTILGNSDDGLVCVVTDLVLLDCILWGNSPQQIFQESSNLQVSYSDIQGGYAGTGNIAAYPAFVNTAQGDYRLQWGSPCIDTGDPNPIYNDPDGTRADMGAWYYDQSIPVRVLLTPYNQPIQIPATGGSFQYAIQVTNIATSTLPVLVWCNATLPSGWTTNPLLGPVTISIALGQTLSRVRTQNVPGDALAGMYHYNAYAVMGADTSKDSFMWGKLGAGIQDSRLGGWNNYGESITDVVASSSHKTGSIHPSAFILHPCFPNPFNPITTLSFTLPEASKVNIAVFDVSGRLVSILVNGWREAGMHEVVFDGSGLSTGIYFARLEAGSFSQVQKLVLMK